MTAERWLAGRVTAAYLGTAIVVFLLVAGIDGIERSRLLTGEGQGGDLGALVAWRLPGLVRELVPVWVGVSTALAVGWLVRSGAWEALQGAGQSEARAATVVLAVGLGLGGCTAAGLELIVPVAAGEAAAAEGRLTGHTARLSGGWVRLAEQAFRVGGTVGNTLVDVTVVTVAEGELSRMDAPRVSWDGQAWVGDVQVTTVGTVEPSAASSLPLPPPRQTEALVRPRATAEAGLQVLGAVPVAGARAWWHRRLAGLVAPGVVALLALGLARRERPGLAASVAVSAVGAGSLHLGVAVLAESVGAVGVWCGWGVAAAAGLYLAVSTRKPR